MNEQVNRPDGASGPPRPDGVSGPPRPDGVSGPSRPDGASGPPVILQVLPALVTGGVERGTVDVAQAIVEAGWKAVVVSQGGPLVRELDRMGALHVCLPVGSKNPAVMALNARRLARVIADQGVRLVHARSRAPAWSARHAAALAGIPFVTTFHGTYTLGPFDLKKEYNRIMTRGERVIAISRFIADHVQDVYGLDPAGLRIIPRGIDPVPFDPARVSAERMIRLARQWRLPDGAPVIMLPGRLTRWKGQGLLIEALARLRNPAVRCLLVGSDQGRVGYRAALEAQAQALGVAGQVHLVDECDDMPAAYMVTDVVVSASTDPEAFGRVVAEAQAMGRPVIAPAHGAAPEVMRLGPTGRLVPPGDPDALAQALAEVLALSAETRAAEAEATRNHVLTRFSKPVMTARTLAVYRELLLGEEPLPDLLAPPRAVPDLERAAPP